MHFDLKEKIISPAWKLVRSDSKIKKIYFFPGLLSIIFLTALLVYQSIYTYVEIFNQKEKVLVHILSFFHSEYFFWTIIAFLVFFLIYILINPIFEWALIHYIEKKWEKLQHDTEDNIVSFSDAFWVGLYRFLPVFEYNNIFSEFKVISVLNAYLFIIRFIWVEYLKTISIVFSLILLGSILLNIFLSYSKFHIILSSWKVMQSIGVSAKITVLNLKTTIQLYFMMFLLNLRVVINFLIFLIFPVIIFSAAFYISSKFFLVLTLALMISLFLFFIILLWYMASVLEVFKTAIWYYAYKEGSKKLEMFHDDGHSDSHHSDSHPH